jgi:protoporphyrinogen/coproporphyrinogen III oxidase
VRHVAVIGAGLAGLTVAWRRARSGDRISVFESEKRLGGQLHTERSAGYVVEHGAEGYVAASEAVATLAEELLVGERVVEQLVQTSYGFDGQALVALAPGEAGQFLGFQVPRREFGKGIRSFAGGMGDLTEALVRALAAQAELRSGARVHRIETKGGRVRVVLEAGAEEFDEVVVATTARSAAGLLEPELGAVAAALRNAVLHSSVTVSNAYARSDIPHALGGTGFVVAEAAQDAGLRACSFVSSKLPSRVPDGRALLRLFYRPGEGEIETLDDSVFRARAEQALRRILGVEQQPERSWVSRWPDALPVFDAAHLARVGALEAALGGTHVRLAGAAFHGSGIDAAVRSAFSAAAALD